jgi:hypothetical protein
MEREQGGDRDCEGTLAAYAGQRQRSSREEEHEQDCPKVDGQVGNVKGKGGRPQEVVVEGKGEVGHESPAANRPWKRRHLEESIQASNPLVKLYRVHVVELKLSVESACVDGDREQKNA